jgi:hypothetical protein
MSAWDAFTPDQWAIIFVVLLLALAFIVADLINNEPWGGFHL